MNGYQFVVVDHDAATRRRVVDALAGQTFASCARTFELGGVWPAKPVLLVRDLDRQINEALLALETFGRSCPIIAYGTNGQPSRLRELSERGVAAYWDISELEAAEARSVYDPLPSAMNDDDVGIQNRQMGGRA